MNLTRRTESQVPFWYCMDGCLDADGNLTDFGGSGPGSDAAAEAHAHDHGHRTSVQNGSRTIYEPAGVTV